jgi:4-amino-4-deoxy-L-arabinose transferase-like glycosyltransferase
VVPSAGRTRRLGRFALGLAGLSLLGLVVRLLAVAHAPRELAFNDGRMFHIQAGFIADGLGFVDPGRLAYTFVAEPSAQHPPLFPLLLATVSWLGHGSVLAHQVTAAVVSAAAVPIIGCVGRHLAGVRAGLVAAGIAAIYPNLWVSDQLVMSESLLAVTFALFLLVLYRWWQSPSRGRAALVGVAIGLAVLTRTEAVLLVPLAVLPLVIGSCQSRREKVVALGVVTLVAGSLVSPWVVRNLLTFEHPVFLTDNSNSVLAGANRRETYEGPALGSWVGEQTGLPEGDESVRGAELRRRGLRYARRHITDLPVVAAARVGRTWDVFRPLQRHADDRPRWVLPWSLAAFWVVQPFAVVGLLRLRGRVPVAPFVGQVVLVTVVAAVGYGLWRFRLPWDVTAIVLAGAGAGVASAGGPGVSG